MERLRQDQIPELGHAVVTLHVGETGGYQKDFLVHADLITSSSRFVRAALAGEWTESDTRTINLPDRAPKHVAIYVQWLYSRKLYTLPASGPESNPLLSEEIETLLKCSSLAYYLLDVDFADTTTDAIHQWYFEGQTETRASQLILLGPRVYDTFPDAAPVRQLIVDISAWTASGFGLERIEAEKSERAKDFLIDVNRAVRRRFLGDSVLVMSTLETVAPMIRHRRTCHYHFHGTETCYKLKNSSEASRKRVSSTTDLRSSRSRRRPSSPPQTIRLSPDSY